MLLLSQFMDGCQFCGCFQHVETVKNFPNTKNKFLTNSSRRVSEVTPVWVMIESNID